MSGDFCFYQIDEGGTPLPLRHSYVLLSIGDALREMEDAHIALRARVAELEGALRGYHAERQRADEESAQAVARAALATGGPPLAVVVRTSHAAVRRTFTRAPPRRPPTLMREPVMEAASARQ